MPTLEATATATPEATATDTPAPQETPTPVFAPSGAEAPPNGGFEAGTQPWVFWINPGAGGKGSLSIGDAAYAGAASGRVSISALPADRNVQLYQRDLALLPNTRYRLSFAAYSSSGRDMTVQLIQHGEPYANYGLSRTVVDLTNQWAVYTYEFTTAGFPEPVGDGRLKFFFGEHARKGDKYYLDEVSLSVAPADGAAP